MVIHEAACSFFRLPNRWIDHSERGSVSGPGCCELTLPPVTCPVVLSLFHCQSYRHNDDPQDEHSKDHEMFRWYCCGIGRTLVKTFGEGVFFGFRGL